MAGILIVALAIGGVSMLTLSLIMQEQAAESGASTARVADLTRQAATTARRLAVEAAVFLRRHGTDAVAAATRGGAHLASATATAWHRAAPRLRDLPVRAREGLRTARSEPSAALQHDAVGSHVGRRPRFHQALEVTIPAQTAGRARAASGDEAWRAPWSRLVATLELGVLIVLVGAAVAAAALGVGHVLAKTLAAHFGG